MILSEAVADGAAVQFSAAIVGPPAVAGAAAGVSKSSSSELLLQVASYNSVVQLSDHTLTQLVRLLRLTITSSTSNIIVSCSSSNPVTLLMRCVWLLHCSRLLFLPLQLLLQ